jgi:hypothetical protein
MYIIFLCLAVAILGHVFLLESPVHLSDSRQAAGVLFKIANFNGRKDF